MRISASISILFFYLLGLNVNAQQSQSLRQKQEALLQNIEATSKEIKHIKAQERQSNQELNLIQKQIKDRQDLMLNVSEQLDSTNTNIDQINSNIIILDQSISQLKSQYGTLMKAYYRKKKLEHPLLSLLNVNGLNEAFIKWRHMAQYQDFLTEKLSQINNKTKSLNKQKNQLQLQEKQQRNILKLQESQQSLLAEEQAAKQKLVEKYSNNAKSLEATLSKQQSESKKLSQQLATIIAAKIKKDVKIDSNEKITNTEKTVRNVLTKKLPWPIDQSRISSRYGLQSHPKLKSIKVDNKGLDFESSSNNEVKAILDGSIVDVVSMVGFDYVLVINHGEYLTAYSKLSNVLVKKGQIVQQGEILGTARSNNSGNFELHFEMFKGKQNLDPEKWLEKR